MRGLFAERADVEADADPARLGRSVVSALVEDAHADHRAVEADDVGVRELGIGRRIEAAVVAEDLDDVRGWVSSGVARGGSESAVRSRAG